MTIHTTDNNCGKSLYSLCSDFTEIDFCNLQKIANQNIDTLVKNNQSLLIFPHSLNAHHDDIEKSVICNLTGEKENFINASLTTNNVMGFIGITDEQQNQTKLRIYSRFSDIKDSTNTTQVSTSDTAKIASSNTPKTDFFFFYLIQKVFGINLVNYNYSSGNIEELDLLIFLFPHFLKKAISQGIYRQYKTFDKNDANVKGVIDVNRFIKNNIPFNGKISYKSRERTFDNEVIQLIRHTIEFIKTKNFGKSLLQNQKEIKEAVSQIIQATPSYSFLERSRVINKNLRNINHPYFSEYVPLQKLCRAILTYKKTSFGNAKNSVHGILFDGAWLWEEYIATVLNKCDFIHSRNKEGRDGFKMFENSRDNELFDKNYRRLYPDFYKEDFILDAKYKRLENGVSREDLYQLVTYMYCKQASKGGFIYPIKEESAQNQTFKLAGYGGEICVIPFHIENKETYEEFCDAMQSQEVNLANLF